MKCKKCKGRGWNQDNDRKKYYSCEKCNGIGKLNKEGKVIVELKEYEKRCEMCKGYGWWASNRGQEVICPICNKTGKIDWIDEIKK